MKPPKSPLRETPLHLPGQSLDEEISRIREEEMPVYFAYLATFFSYALLEWFRWIIKAPYSPVLFTVAAAAVIGYCVFRLNVLRKRARSLELGRDGERIVGEILDQLKGLGCAILHDVPGAGFNIDHVVFAPQGIYTVETKTLSKPRGAEIGFRGDKLVAGKAIIGSEPLSQAQAEARWLRSVLEQALGKRYPVRPVLLFVGWFVHPMPRSIKEHLWVLNPKALPGFIQNEPVCLSNEEMKSIVFQLATYERTRGKGAAKYVIGA